MNAEDIGWMAGVLDGEGCIYASKPWKTEPNRKNGRVQFGIYVIITNSSQLLLEKFGELLRDERIEYKYRDGCSKHTAEIAIRKKSEVMRFIPLVISHLTAKKRSANAVMEYLQKWPGRPKDVQYGTPASEEQIRDYIKLYNVLKKQKGKSPLSVETIRQIPRRGKDIVRSSK